MSCCHDSSSLEIEPQADSLVYMQVAEGEFEGVEAVQKAIAEWSIDEQDPAKMYVTFVRTQFEPKQKDAESVQRWNACFKEHNPGMVRAMLPQHLHRHALNVW